MTHIHTAACECPFCVLEHQNLQLCDMKIILAKTGMEVFFPKTHAQHATHENGRALSQIFDALLTNPDKRRRVTVMKRGEAEVFHSKTSSLAIECLVDKRAWKVCFHTKQAPLDEDPN